MRRLAAATALLVLLLAPAARADTLRGVVERPLLVVGGHDAAPGSWPSMAAIVLSTQPDARSGQFCGGTVIAPTAVLTAAHCVRDDAGAVRSPAFFDVVVGRESLRAAGGQRVHVASVQVHPSNDPQTVRYDAAILLLAEPVGAPPIRLADRGRRRRPRHAGIAGARRGLGRDRRRRQRVPGRAAGGGDPAAVRRVLPDRASRACRTTPPSMACAAYDEDDADVCNGDSGGPLARQDAAGAWVQLGIVSWGLEGGCDAPRTPTAYAQVSAIRDWAIGIAGLPAGRPARCAGHAARQRRLRPSTPRSPSARRRRRRPLPIVRRRRGPWAAWPVAARSSACATA